MVMLQILPSILTPHSLTFLSNFPFEGSWGNDSFLIERRHTHVKDLNMSDMNLNMGEIFLTYVIIHQVCDHTILKFVYLLIQSSSQTIWNSWQVSCFLCTLYGNQESIYWGFQIFQSCLTCFCRFGDYCKTNWKG